MIIFFKNTVIEADAEVREARDIYTTETEYPNGRGVGVFPIKVDKFDGIHHSPVKYLATAMAIVSFPLVFAVAAIPVVTPTPCGPELSRGTLDWFL